MFGRNFAKGLAAGFVATCVISVLMIVKTMIGFAPQVSVIAMLTRMAGAGTPGVGWAIHFAVGTLLWGGLFSWIDSNLRSEIYWLHGLGFAFFAWLAMMILLMPLAGAGFFGLELGAAVPVVTFVFHMIYGAVLGAVYGAERPETLVEAGG